MKNVSKFTIIGDIPEDKNILFKYLEPDDFHRIVSGEVIATRTPYLAFNSSWCNRKDNFVYADDTDKNTEWLIDDNIELRIEFNGNSFEVPEGWWIYGVAIMPDNEESVVFALFDKQDIEKSAWFFPPKKNEKSLAE